MRSSRLERQDRFANLLGVEFEEIGFEKTICRLKVQEDHYNVLGTIHGGVIFSLADITFAAAGDASEATFIGTQTEIRYMKQAETKELLAIATLINASKRFAYYQVEVFDGKQNMVALFMATAYRLK